MGSKKMFSLGRPTFKNFGPILWQAAEIIGGLLATVTESQTPKGTQDTGG